jgi:hypothetical protein
MREHFDYSVKIKLTEEEKETLAAQKKKVVEFKEERIVAMIKSGSGSEKLMKISDEIFNVVLPPKQTKTILNINDWYSYMLSRVKNPIPFNEMLASHAYKRRHPESHIEKVFALYDSHGETGKGYVLSCLASIYGAGKSNIEVKTDQIENDKFNNWMSTLRM